MIFDAHLDLAMNAIEWNRDLTCPVAEIREMEAHLSDKPDRGRGTVCLPEMRRGKIGLCVATQIARVEHNAWSPVAGWRSPAQARAMTQAQREWYRAMEEAGEMTLVHDRASLERQLALWSADTMEHEMARRPVGFLLSLEGADSLITLRHLEKSVEDGLRAIGPAHYGPGVYAQGTDTTGGFNARGRDLLREAERLGLILDVTHLSDECFWEALDLFSGPIWASHHNCRALVPHQRQLNDEMIRALIQREAVIGAVFDAWMLVPGWQRRQTTPESSGLTLRQVAEHIDHICQIAGNARHCGIGSDLDGAFGREQCPPEIETIGDLPRLAQLLAERGFSSADVAHIMDGNFVRFLRSAWKV